VTTYYLNGSATDWASTTSWRDGVVPVSGPTNVIVVAESGPPVTAGLDQAGVSINKLVIASGVRKKIGGNGESLKIDIDAGVDPRVIHHGAGGVDLALYIDGTLPRVELAGGALLSVTGGNVGGVLGLVGDGCRMEVSSSAIYGGEAGDTGVLRLTGSGNATIASHASDRLGVVSIEGHARLSTRRSIAGGTITGGARSRFWVTRRSATPASTRRSRCTGRGAGSLCARTRGSRSTCSTDGVGRSIWMGWAAT